MEEKSCQTCAHSLWAVAHPREVLICRHKPDTPRRWHVRNPHETCPAYTPDPSCPPPAPTMPPIPPGRDPQSVCFIPLTKGCFTLVDAEDYPRLSRHKWHAVGRPGAFYAARCKNKKTVLMHRDIMHLSPGRKALDGKSLVVDHIDRNPLNNTRANLRLCTQQQNMCNRPLPPKTSKYRGVYWIPRYKKWLASIRHDGKSFHLGYFKAETDAAKAFDKKAKHLRGEYACLNFPEEEHSSK